MTDQNAILINALYWCHAIQRYAGQTWNDPDAERWPQDVKNGTRFAIVDWIDAPEAAKVAKETQAFQNPAPENLIFHILELGDMDEGCGHDLYQRLCLREDTLMEHLLNEPRVSLLPTDMLCDALLDLLADLSVYSDPLRLGYSRKDLARFDFAPPITELPFDPGPLTFLFKDLVQAKLSERVLGGYKWTETAIASFKRLRRWPTEEFDPRLRAIWSALPTELKHSALLGLVEQFDLAKAVQEVDQQLAKAGTYDQPTFEDHLILRAREPSSQVMLRFARSILPTLVGNGDISADGNG